MAASCTGATPLKNATLDLLSGSDSLPVQRHGLGVAKARGETTAGSGAYDQKLYATA